MESERLQRLLDKIENESRRWLIHCSIESRFHRFREKSK